MAEYADFHDQIVEGARRRARNYLIGIAGTATAATMYNFNKRSRSSQDTTGSSLTTASQALASIHGAHELVTRKREPAASFRLHSAKFLMMDKMLKSLFFPLNTTVLKFGISSFSGSNLSNIVDKTGLNSAESRNTVDQLRTRGLYRGIVMFDVRNTDPEANRSTVDALNCKPITVGEISTSTATNQITSIYRRFHARPAQTGASDGGTIINNGPPVLTTEDSINPNTLRSISLGSNLNDIEELATAGMCYADPQVAFYKNRYPARPFFNPLPPEFVANQESANTGLINNQNPVNNGADVEDEDLTWTGPSKDKYWTRFKDAVVRLPDGSVEVDIMNTEHSPCVVEVVVHSRKGSHDIPKSAVYKQLWNDVERHLSAKNVINDPDPTSNPVGGWQAFFDPTYPLLKIPSKGETNRYVNEVHRSNHVLAPGQSKKVKIALGSLYYKIGSKTDSAPLGEPSFNKEPDNNGALYFTIGHSGFEYPQTVTDPGDQTQQIWTAPSTASGQTFPFGNVRGTGFWVGKANAPSSISIDGTYTDKFYPITFDRQPQSIYSAGFPRIATVGGFGDDDRAAIPLATIVPQRVAAGEESVVQSL